QYPIHDIYIEMILYDPYFISKVPHPYINGILDNMLSKFFTFDTFKYIHLVKGKSFKKYYGNVSLYQIYDSNDKLWKGYIENNNDFCFGYPKCKNVHDQILVNNVDQFLS